MKSKLFLTVLLLAATTTIGCSQDSQTPPPEGSTLIQPEPAAKIGVGIAQKKNRLSIGMTKAEVISAMGRPSYTAPPAGGVEILRYDRSPSDAGHFATGSSEPYFVMLVDGKVRSYGTIRIMDPTEKSTLDVTIKAR